MTGKRKILLICKHLNLGGAERLLIDSLPYLDRDRFEYHVAYMLSGRDHLVPQLEAQDIPVHCLRMTTNYQFPQMLPRLHHLQRRLQFDLIHAHLPLPGIVARLVGRWHHIPVVYTEHNLPERQHPVTLRINGLCYGWNQHVFAVSRGVHDSLTRLGWAQKTNVTPLLNGIPIEQVQSEAQKLDELRRELNIPSGDLVVGTVAVMSRQKRLLDWVRVAHRIAAERRDVTFLLAGHGPEDVAIRREVKALGLSDRVRLPGFRSDGRRVMGTLDVYLMTSEFEGLPVALLEAMALAKPIVATAVGGIPEVVTSGKEGFLANVGDVDTIATKTMQLLNDAERRREMGQMGAKKVKDEFRTKDRVKVIEGVYSELLK